MYIETTPLPKAPLRRAQFGAAGPELQRVQNSLHHSCRNTPPC